MKKRRLTTVPEGQKEPRDSKGWPLSFWASLGQLDESFDVGDRRQPHERPAPLNESDDRGMVGP